MNSTTKVTKDIGKMMFGEGVMVLKCGDEIEFQFTFYRDDKQVKVALERGKVGLEMLSELTLKAKNNAKEAVKMYIGEAA